MGLTQQLESMLRNWGNVIKAGTTRAIARAFFTGVTPQAFADGLSGLNMVKDISFLPTFAGFCGLTHNDVHAGLKMIDRLTPQQRVDYAEQMRTLYNGYRFAKGDQVEVVYNSQYVLYFLDHLQQEGVPPTSLIDRSVCNTSDNVAKFLIKNHGAGAAYSLLNFVLGIIRPEERGTFTRDVVPLFRREDLFRESSVGDSLVSLAYFHGFLTYKLDAEGHYVLTSPNLIAEMLYAESLFAELPVQCQEKLLSQIQSKATSAEIKNTLTDIKDGQGATRELVRVMEQLGFMG